MNNGVLTVELQTQSDDPMVLFVDEYDAEYGEWLPVTGAITNDGSLLLELDIAEGEYAFSVISLGQGGEFTVDASLVE